MKGIFPAIWVELLKARRSKLPLMTLLGSLLVPFFGGLFMIILKDPALARRLGIISAKAQILAGTADWPTFLGLLAQATAVGGFILFGIIASWLVGREYADHTLRDLLALPTSRSAIVLAKFIVIMLWSAVLIAIIFLISLGVGAAVDLPPAPSEVFRQGAVTLAVTACLAIALVTPTVFFASAGHGYLAPIGFMILVVILSQVVIVLGWGEYFPWSVPALRTGMAGPQYAGLGLVSYAVVILTCLAGIFGTLLWWELADQKQ